MSFSFKLKPRIKPRLGVKPADGPSNVKTVNSNATLPPPAASSDNEEKDKSPSSPGNDHPRSPQVPIISSTSLDDAADKTTPVDSTSSEDGAVSSDKKTPDPTEKIESSTALPELNDSFGANKTPIPPKTTANPNDVSKTPKSRILKLKQHKPVFKNPVRPVPNAKSPENSDPTSSVKSRVADTSLELKDPNSEASPGILESNEEDHTSSEKSLKLKDVCPQTSAETEDVLSGQVGRDVALPKECGIGGVIKKHPLIKEPPMILKKVPKIKSRTPLVSSELDSVKDIALSEKANDNEESDGQSLKNTLQKNTPVINTSRCKIPSSATVASHSTADPDSPVIKDPPDDSEQTNKLPVDKTRSCYLPKAKTSKGDVEDVRTLCAISAVDYLRRHDHALGDSIIRKLIIGSKNMQNRNLKPSMCSSCNPQTLKKCLSSLSAVQPDELHVILKKSAERQKTPLSFASFSGKPLFKPSLGRQRAPTLTASTYGKMCFEVKEDLARKYGHKTPELSKLRMLDLIFYNPTDNPMSKKTDDDSDGTSKLSPQDSSTIESKDKTSKSSAEGSEDSDADDPEILGGQPTADSAKDSETNNNSLPVPQVRIGDEGQIILAPESLVLKQKDSEVLNNPVVHESDFAGVVRKRDSLNRTSWSFEETVKFYKSLHTMGTDFSSMLTLFPNRTRKNLKAKFKREERKNSALIDKVLSSQGQNLNMADVEKDLATDKTLRRLCIETNQKSSSDSPISCILDKPNRRRRKKNLSEDEEESPPSSRQGTPLSFATSFSNKTGAHPDPSQTPKSDDEISADTTEGVESIHTNENKSSSSKLEEDNTVKSDFTNSHGKSVDQPLNLTRRKFEKKLPSIEQDDESSKKLESATESFKKPVGRPPNLKKRKLEKKVPNIVRKGKKAKPNEPTRHIMCLDDTSDDCNKEDAEDLSDSPAPVDSVDDNCFVIETNFENESFNCVKSVKFSVDNPDILVDVNATIEHKSPLEETTTETKANTDDSVEDVQVVTININQLPLYLKETGAVVVGKDQS